MMSGKEREILFLHAHKAGGTAYIKYLQSLGYTLNTEDNGNVSIDEGRNQSKFTLICFEHQIPNLEYPWNREVHMILRDPVERHWSNYCYDQIHRNYPEAESLEQYTKLAPIHCQGNYYHKWLMGISYLRDHDTFQVDHQYIDRQLSKVDKLMFLCDIEMPIENRNNRKLEMTKEQRAYLQSINDLDIKLYNRLYNDSRNNNL